jgi:hypothetical protein
MRVLSTSNGNVTTHPRTPAAPPARSSPAHERCASASVSCTSPGAGCTGAQRRSVASYCARNVIRRGTWRREGMGHARRRSTFRNRQRRAGSSRTARGRAHARRPRGRCALRLCVRARRALVACSERCCCCICCCVLISSMGVVSSVDARPQPAPARNIWASEGSSSSGRTCTFSRKRYVAKRQSVQYRCGRPVSQRWVEGRSGVA